jgi:hypothetical protein
VLEIDPADTMGQARIFFGDVRSEDIEGLLKQPRWAENPKLIKQWKRSEFEAAFVALLELGMVTEANRAEFDGHTKTTNRPDVCFAPGLTFQ